MSSSRWWSSFGCALAVVVAVLVPGCKKPAALAFSPNAPIVIDGDRGVKIPSVVALDADGKPLEKTPPVALTTDPIGVATVDGALLLPAKNGTTKLRATAEGLPPVDLPVRVSVVDDLRVTCPAPCNLHVGDTVKLDVVASGLGEKITTGIAFTSSDPAHATVDDTGTVTAAGVGVAVVNAKLGKKSVDTKLEIRPAVDELRVWCAWPPLAVDVKKAGDGFGAGDRSCEVLEGEDTKIAVVPLAHGNVVNDEHIDWKSSDPSVRAVGDTLTGDRPGGSMIEVHAADLVAEVPMSVVSAKQKGTGNGHCTERGYGDAFDVAYSFAGPEGARVEDKATFRCETAAGQRCVEGAVPEIVRAVEGASWPFSSDVSLRFGKASLDERAHRCCCKR